MMRCVDTLFSITTSEPLSLGIVVSLHEPSFKPSMCQGDGAADSLPCTKASWACSPHLVDQCRHTEVQADEETSHQKDCKNVKRLKSSCTVLRSTGSSICCVPSGTSTFCALQHYPPSHTARQRSPESRGKDAIAMECQLSTSTLHC
jgi:hypothetical protein